METMQSGSSMGYYEGGDFKLLSFAFNPAYTYVPRFGMYLQCASDYCYPLAYVRQISETGVTLLVRNENSMGAEITVCWAAE